MTEPRLWKVGLAAYAAAAIVTFGHAAVSAERVGEGWRQECRAEAKEPQSCPNYADRAVMIAPIAALFWPLYWSWKAWS